MFGYKQPHGFGRCEQHKLGVIYEGTFKYGLRQGLAKEIYGDGVWYLGSFGENARFGWGKYSDGSGAIFDGKWDSGRI